jgi:hypothetical protein
MGGHGDEIDGFVVREADEFGGRIAIEDDAADGDAGELIGEEGVEFTGGLITAGAINVDEHGAGDIGAEVGMEVGEDVREDEFGLAMSGEITGVMGGAGSAL